MNPTSAPITGRMLSAENNQNVLTFHSFNNRGNIIDTGSGAYMPEEQQQPRSGTGNTGQIYIPLANTSRHDSTTRRLPPSTIASVARRIPSGSSGATPVRGVSFVASAKQQQKQKQPVSKPVVVVSHPSTSDNLKKSCEWLKNEQKEQEARRLASSSARDRIKTIDQQTRILHRQQAEQRRQKELQLLQQFVSAEQLQEEEEEVAASAANEELHQQLDKEKQQKQQHSGGSSSSRPGVPRLSKAYVNLNLHTAAAAAASSASKRSKTTGCCSDEDDDDEDEYANDDDFDAPGGGSQPNPLPSASSSSAAKAAAKAAVKASRAATGAKKRGVVSNDGDDAETDNGVDGNATANPLSEKAASEKQRRREEGKRFLTLQQQRIREKEQSEAKKKEEEKKKRAQALKDLDRKVWSHNQKMQERHEKEEKENGPGPNRSKPRAPPFDNDENRQPRNEQMIKEEDSMVVRDVDDYEDDNDVSFRFPWAPSRNIKDASSSKAAGSKNRSATAAGASSLKKRTDTNGANPAVNNNIDNNNKNNNIKSSAGAGVQLSSSAIRSKSAPRLRPATSNPSAAVKRDGAAPFRFTSSNPAAAATTNKTSLKNRTAGTLPRGPSLLEESPTSRMYSANFNDDDNDDDDSSSSNINKTTKECAWPRPIESRTTAALGDDGRVRVNIPNRAKSAPVRERPTAARGAGASGKTDGDAFFGRRSGAISLLRASDNNANSAATNRANSYARGGGDGGGNESYDMQQHPGVLDLLGSNGYFSDDDDNELPPLKPADPTDAGSTHAGRSGGASGGQGPVSTGKKAARTPSSSTTATGPSKKPAVPTKFSAKPAVPQQSKRVATGKKRGTTAGTSGSKSKVKGKKRPPVDGHDSVGESDYYYASPARGGGMIALPRHAQSSERNLFDNAQQLQSYQDEGMGDAMPAPPPFTSPRSALAHSLGAPAPASTFKLYNDHQHHHTAPSSSSVPSATAASDAGHVVDQVTQNVEAAARVLDHVSRMCDQLREQSAELEASLEYSRTHRQPHHGGSSINSLGPRDSIDSFLPAHGDNNDNRNNHDTVSGEEDADLAAIRASIVAKLSSLDKNNDFPTACISRDKPAGRKARISHDNNINGGEGGSSQEDGDMPLMSASSQEGSDMNNDNEEDDEEEYSGGKRSSDSDHDTDNDFYQQEQKFNHPLEPQREIQRQENSRAYSMDSDDGVLISEAPEQWQSHQQFPKKQAVSSATPAIPYGHMAVNDPFLAHQLGMAADRREIVGRFTADMPTAEDAANLSTTHVAGGTAAGMSDDRNGEPYGIEDLMRPDTRGGAAGFRVPSSVSRGIKGEGSGGDNYKPGSLYARLGDKPQQQRQQQHHQLPLLRNVGALASLLDDTYGPKEEEDSVLLRDDDSDKSSNDGDEDDNDFDENFSAVQLVANSMKAEQRRVQQEKEAKQLQRTTKKEAAAAAAAAAASSAEYKSWSEGEEKAGDIDGDEEGSDDSASAAATKESVSFFDKLLNRPLSEAGGGGGGGSPSRGGGHYDHDWAVRDLHRSIHSGSGTADPQQQSRHGSSPAEAQQQRLTGAELRVVMMEELQRQEDLFKYEMELAELEKTNALNAAKELVEQDKTRSEQQVSRLKQQQELEMQKLAYEHALVVSLSNTHLASERAQLEQKEEVLQLQASLTAAQLRTEYAQMAMQAEHVQQQLELDKQLAEAAHEVVLRDKQREGDVMRMSMQADRDAAIAKLAVNAAQAARDDARNAAAAATAAANALQATVAIEGQRRPPRGGGGSSSSSSQQRPSSGGSRTSRSNGKRPSVARGRAKSQDDSVDNSYGADSFDDYPEDDFDSVEDEYSMTYELTKQQQQRKKYGNSEDDIDETIEDEIGAVSRTHDSVVDDSIEDIAAASRISRGSRGSRGAAANRRFDQSVATASVGEEEEEEEYTRDDFDEIDDEIDVRTNSDSSSSDFAADDSIVDDDEAVVVKSSSPPQRHGQQRKGRTTQSSDSIEDVADSYDDEDKDEVAMASVDDEDGDDEIYEDEDFEEGTQYSENFDASMSTNRSSSRASNSSRRKRPSSAKGKVSPNSNKIAAPKSTKGKGKGKGLMDETSSSAAHLAHHILPPFEESMLASHLENVGPQSSAALQELSANQQLILDEDFLERVIADYRQEMEQRMRASERSHKLRVKFLEAKKQQSMQELQLQLQDMRPKPSSAKAQAMKQSVVDRFAEESATLERERWDLNARAYKELRKFRRLREDLVAYRSGVLGEGGKSKSSKVVVDHLSKLSSSSLPDPANDSFESTNSISGSGSGSGSGGNANWSVPKKQLLEQTQQQQQQRIPPPAAVPPAAVTSSVLSETPDDSEYADETFDDSGSAKAMTSNTAAAAAAATASAAPPSSGIAAAAKIDDVSSEVEEVMSADDIDDDPDQEYEDDDYTMDNDVTKLTAVATSGEATSTQQQQQHEGDDDTYEEDFAASATIATPPLLPSAASVHSPDSVKKQQGDKQKDEEEEEEEGGEDGEDGYNDDEFEEDGSTRPSSVTATTPPAPFPSAAAGDKGDDEKEEEEEEEVSEVASEIDEFSDSTGARDGDEESDDDEKNTAARKAEERQEELSGKEDRKENWGEKEQAVSSNNIELPPQLTLAQKTAAAPLVVEDSQSFEDSSFEASGSSSARASAPTAFAVAPDSSPAPTVTLQSVVEQEEEEEEEPQQQQQQQHPDETNKKTGLKGDNNKDADEIESDVESIESMLDEQSLSQSPTGPAASTASTGAYAANNASSFDSSPSKTMQDLDSSMASAAGRLEELNARVGHLEVMVEEADPTPAHSRPNSLPPSPSKSPNKTRELGSSLRSFEDSSFAQSEDEIEPSPTNAVATAAGTAGLDSVQKIDDSSTNEPAQPDGTASDAVDTNATAEYADEDFEDDFEDNEEEEEEKEEDAVGTDEKVGNNNDGGDDGDDSPIEQTSVPVPTLVVRPAATGPAADESSSVSEVDDDMMSIGTDISSANSDGGDDGQSSYKKEEGDALAASMDELEKSVAAGQSHAAEAATDNDQQQQPTSTSSSTAPVSSPPPASSISIKPVSSWAESPADYEESVDYELDFVAAADSGCDDGDTTNNNKNTRTPTPTGSVPSKSPALQIGSLSGGSSAHNTPRKGATTAANLDSSTHSSGNSQGQGQGQPGMVFDTVSQRWVGIKEEDEVDMDGFDDSSSGASSKSSGNSEKKQPLTTTTAKSPPPSLMISTNNDEDGGDAYDGKLTMDDSLLSAVSDSPTDNNNNNNRKPSLGMGLMMEMIGNDDDENVLLTRPAHGRAKGMRGSGSPDPAQVAAAKAAAEEEDDERTVMWPYSKAAQAAADAVHQIVSPIGGAPDEEEAAASGSIPNTARTMSDMSDEGHATRTAAAAAAAMEEVLDGAAEEVDAEESSSSAPQSKDEGDDDVLDLLEELDDLDRSKSKSSPSKVQGQKGNKTVQKEEEVVLELSSETIEGSMHESDYDIILDIGVTATPTPTRSTAPPPPPANNKPKTIEEQADEITNILMERLLKESFQAAGVTMKMPAATEEKDEEQTKEKKESDTHYIVAPAVTITAVSAAKQQFDKEEKKVVVEEEEEEDIPEEVYSDDEYDFDDKDDAEQKKEEEEKKPSKVSSLLGSLPSIGPSFGSSSKDDKKSSTAAAALPSIEMSDELDELYEFDFEPSPAAGSSLHTSSSSSSSPKVPVIPRDPEADRLEAEEKAAAAAAELEAAQLELRIETIKTETQEALDSMLDCHDDRNGSDGSLAVKLGNPAYQGKFLTEADTADIAEKSGLSTSVIPIDALLDRVNEVLSELHYLKHHAAAAGTSPMPAFVTGLGGGRAGGAAGALNSSSQSAHSTHSSGEGLTAGGGSSGGGLLPSLSVRFLAQSLPTADGGTALRKYLKDRLRHEQVVEGEVAAQLRGEFQPHDLLCRSKTLQLETLDQFQRESQLALQDACSHIAEVLLARCLIGCVKEVETLYDLSTLPSTLETSNSNFCSDDDE